jgi:LacI family transcriptional regulator
MSDRPHVALIVETSLAYGRAVLGGISRYIVAHRPWSLYVDLRELLAEPPAWLDTWRGDGVISRSTTPELVRNLRRRKIPAVDLTDSFGDQGLPHVWIDHHAVGRAAAIHLLERGFRHFGFCGFSAHDWSARRLAGFREQLAAARYECHVFESPWDTSKTGNWEAQQREIGRWLVALPKPAGVLACNDMRGQHVLDACRRENLAVPETVAVIGCDNDELLCQLCDPPLSSVVPSAERIGYEAAALLDRLMQGDKAVPFETLIEPSGIVTRQSTDVLAIDDQLIGEAVRYIREHACEGITVAQVLKQVPLSRSMLEKRFRRHLNQSPQDVIRTVQIKRAKQLLAETDLALVAIARLAGFKHVEYLSVVFKRETGQTPGQYRKQVQV